MENVNVSKIQQKIAGTQFANDLEQPLDINGVVSSRGYYNLILSIRDLKLFTVGIKPHRLWKLKNVKTYFNVSGNTQAVLQQLEAIKTALPEL